MRGVAPDIADPADIKAVAMGQYQVDEQQRGRARDAARSVDRGRDRTSGRPMPTKYWWVRLWPCAPIQDLASTLGLTRSTTCGLPVEQRIARRKIRQSEYHHIVSGEVSS